MKLRSPPVLQIGHQGVSSNKAELWGETEHQDVWTDLADVLDRPLGDIVIRRAFIDSGFRPGKKDEVPEHRVYEFCRRHARIAYAVKGFDHRDQPLPVKRIDVTPKGKAARYGFDLVRLDSDFFRARCCPASLESRSDQAS